MAHYSIVPLLREAQKSGVKWVWAIGQRSNGKTFSSLREIIDHYLQTGEHSRYLRRFDESIKQKNIRSLCDPHAGHLERVTDGKYNGFHYYSGRFYLAKYDAEGNREYTDPRPFMICNSLNTWESNKGADEGVCYLILYDEVLTRSRYLDGEFVLLLNYVSSVMRDRVGGCVVLLGNTVSKSCPIALEMGINLYALKQGTVTRVKNQEGKTLVLVEYCPPSDNTERTAAEYFAFSSPQVDMITTGAWEEKLYPHLPRGFQEGNHVLYTVSVVYGNTPPFVIEVRRRGSYYYGFVRPTGAPDKATIVLTDSTDPEQKTRYRYCYGYFEKVRPLEMVVKLLRGGDFYFSTNTAGEDFRAFTHNFPGFPLQYAVK